MGFRKKKSKQIFMLFFQTGRLSPPYTAPYYASKYATEAFSDSLRLEVKPWGISVHIIEPTLYKTGIVTAEGLKRDWSLLWKKQPQAVRGEIGQRQFETCK